MIFTNTYVDYAFVCFNVLVNMVRLALIRNLNDTAFSPQYSHSAQS